MVGRLLQRGYGKYCAALQRLREAFSIYKELLSYEPIKGHLELHFPIFKTWDEVYVNKNLATWSKKGQIDKFLHKCTQIKINGSGILQYRIWEVSLVACA